MKVAVYVYHTAAVAELSAFKSIATIPLSLGLVSFRRIRGDRMLQRPRGL